MRVHCKLTQFHTPWFYDSFQSINQSNQIYIAPYVASETEAGSFHGRPVQSAPPPVVCCAHIDQPEVLVHCKLTQFNSPPSPRVLLRYGFRSHLPEAIAARRFSIIYIDFALGLAATLGLTPGSAMHF